MTWIQTFTGKQFDLAHPDPNLIDIVDIAHALSNICRFTGHVTMFDSVAQHSLVVAQLVPPDDALAGLMHDATEAYVTDVSRPLKQMLPEYQRIEESVWHAICARFDLPLVLPSSVKEADNVSLMWEKRDLMGSSPRKWDAYLEAIAARVPDEPYRPMTPMLAEASFLAQFRQLMARRTLTAAPVAAP